MKEKQLHKLEAILKEQKKNIIKAENEASTAKR